MLSGIAGLFGKGAGDAGQRAKDLRMRTGLAGLSLLAGCSAPAPEPAPPGAASSTAGSQRGAEGNSGALGNNSAPAVAGSAAPVRLPPPGPVRNWAEVRHQAALRLVAANPNGTYTGTVPDQLLAIPVLEIELNGDGSVRRIEYLRLPRQAKDTTQLAVDAVRRAAPFGDVSRLPKPWRFTETFLFNDERKFKPRTLD
ncbi:hypothetical protein BH11PSE8_BH11PSE8_47340 [soil metagenome]